MLANVFSALREEFEFARSTRVQPRLGKPQSSFLVNGSPKSGTTWVVRMLSSLPGYYPAGNLQGDLEAYRNVRDGSVLHGHEVFSEELVAILCEQRIQVVLIIRDPRDQAVSHMFHILRDEGHLAHHWLRQLQLDQALMYTIRGRAGMIGGTGEALKLTNGWLRNQANIISVKYEDLHSDTALTLHEILRRLNLEVSDQLINAIVFRNRFERLSAGRKLWQNRRKQGESDNRSHFRKGIVGDWRNYFNDNHRQVFKEIAGEALIELGYETSLDW